MRAQNQWRGISTAIPHCRPDVHLAPNRRLSNLTDPDHFRELGILLLLSLCSTAEYLNRETPPLGRLVLKVGNPEHRCPNVGKFGG